MSHNKIKVGGKSPNTNGEVTVELNDLNDVSVSSPTNGTLLKYVSSNWAGGNPGFDSTDYVFVASNKQTGSVSDLYNTTTVNSIVTDSRNSGYGREEAKGSASSFSSLYQSGTTFGGNVQRISGFSLPANTKFLLILSHTPIFGNSSGETLLQWMDENDVALGPKVLLKDGDRGSKKLFGYVEVGGSDLKVFATCTSTTQHKRQNKQRGDSWQAIRIG
tara:strand:+ start:767 stop:1420 length:654 start_codon:yes stop_codon:yes gene_type:complete